MADRKNRIRELIIGCAPGLTLLMMKHGAPGDLAEDIVHDVLERVLTIFESRDSAGVDRTVPGLTDELLMPGNEERFRRYLFAAAVNRYRDELRKVRRQKESALLWIIDPPLQGPEADTIREERAQQLYRALNQLREPYFTIFRRLVHEDLSLAEIARDSGIPLNSIYTQFRRGIRQLRRILDETA